MAQRFKEHHIVPEVLQRRFLAESEKLWYSSRGKDGAFSPPILRNIKKNFRIRNYYTILADGQLSDVVERAYYGAVDDFLGRLLPDVLPILSRGSPPNLSQDTADSVRRTVLAMLRRTPDFIDHPQEEDIGRDLRSQVLDKIDGSGDFDLRDAEKLGLMSDENLKFIGRTVRVNAALHNSPKTIEAMSDF
ncbi:DUF4238 domain-containing protein [Roseovarius sp. C7]|uniref:DUF4238 domain-containing protein n=1 Tax=Roseovarius sp. C7 TaxID=3398643 RepID=UPI0039F735E7